MQFKDIIGQDKVKRHMLDMFANQRVPHAMLLLGPDGAGALALAVAYAQYINCTGNKSSDDSCGQCPSCQKYAKAVHPDLHFIYPVVKRDESTSSASYIDEWRSMFCRSHYFDLAQWTDEMGGNKQALISKNDALAIHHDLSMQPLEAQYQVLVMWKPELMNEAASNKILKILEEPPANTIFILVSNSASDILPTILSRVQTIKVPPISEDAIAAQIESQYQMSQSDAKRVAHMAAGSYLSALRIIDATQETNDNLEFFKQLMRSSYVKDFIVKMKLSESVAKTLSREQLKDKLNYSQRMLREGFVMNLNSPELNYITPQEEVFLQKFSEFIHIDNVFELSDTINEAIAQIEQNGNVNIIMMDMILKISILLTKPRQK